MSAKDYLIPSPDPFGQILIQRFNSERFMQAYKALKSPNHADWDTLAGRRCLSGFIGCSDSTSGRLMISGRIRSYKIGGVHYFLIPEVVKAINKYPEIFRYVWNSYGDDKHSPDEMIVHWRKFLYPDHVLVLFTFERTTLSAVLPPEMWTRNYRIGNILIKLINKHLKTLVDEKN